MKFSIHAYTHCVPYHSLYFVTILKQYNHQFQNIKYFKAIFGLSQNDTQMTILFMTLSYAYNGNKENYTLFNQLDLKLDEI